MAFSPLESKNIIIEDFSRGPVAEPVFTKLVAPANTISTGTVRALVINIQLANGSAASREILAPGYQAGADQIKQMSRGLTEIQIDYFGRNVVVDVPDCSAASTDIIATTANVQAATEVDLDLYRFISYVIPKNLRCTFAGLAYRSSRNSWNVADGLGFQAGTVAHEWGHNLSLDHSNAMKCQINNAPTQFASRDLRGQGVCTLAEYGGAYSRMGSGNAGTITFLERLQLGWLREGEFQTSYQGTYTLNFDAAPALLMLQNSEGDLFMIEYGDVSTPPILSQRYDWFTKQFISGPFVNGVIVHYLSEYKKSSTTPAIQAEGKSPEELEAELNEKYKTFLKRPDLVVVVRNYANNRAFIGGTAVRPGLEDLRPVVILRSFAAPQVFVGGEVTRPGVLAYRGRLSALSAIVESGGAKPGAQVASVLVLRRTGPEQAVIIRRDLRPDQNGEGTNDILLEPFDIVVVPKTAISQVGEFMEQLFGMLPPLKNSAFGFAYQLNSTNSKIVLP